MEEVLDRAVDRQQAVHVSGAPGSGKSSIAQKVVAMAAERGMHPLLVAAPSGAADAGVLALASVARRLGGNQAARGGWTKLRPRAAQLLRDDREIVVVIDEPSSWTMAGGIFARRAEEAVETLFGPDADWPTVVCDQSAEPDAVLLPAVGREELATADWGLLSDAARKLSTLAIASELRTPLEQRLASAILAWGREPDQSDAHRLATQLAETLITRRHGAALWGVWQRLALARTPVDISTLGALGADRLTPIAASTLSVALMDGANRLHDVLRTIPEDRPPDPELVAAQRKHAHELLFEHHYARFQKLADDDDPEAADHAAEALFHAGELEDETRASLISVDLVEQLNALGHRLGTIHRDDRAAVTVYQRAVLVDPHDGHAVHHLAFHRDAQGLEADSVDAGYVHALKLEPDQPAWHARRVSFLVDTAHPTAARRAWAHAESALADDRGAGNLYAAMHFPVAASLLAAGELSFCSYVLEGVPEHARDPRYRDLSGLLAGRLAGQDQGAVVPAPRSGGRWWADGPERLPARDTAGRGLTTWMAGRVEAIDDTGVEVRVARVDAEAGPEGIGLTRISFEDLAARLLDAIDPRTLRVGRFVEIGRYRHGQLEARTGIVVLSPPPVSMPIDLLPAGRWQTDLPHGPTEH